MTFKELLLKHSHSQRAQETLYFLSKKIKNIHDYIEHKEQEIDFDEQTFNSYLTSNSPIERLTKKVFFYENEFELLDQVFCPRHETETLIEALKPFEPLEGNYIDLCSGTGIIGITILKRNPKLKGTLLDISDQSIENIKINIKKHSISANVIHDDWLNHLQNKNYSIITANFPYVGLQDPIDDHLTNNEPSIALFAKDGGWEHYDKLLKHLDSNNKWNLVVLECSALHEDRWEQAKNIYKKFRFNFLNDTNGLLRIVVISKLK